MQFNMNCPPSPPTPPPAGEHDCIVGPSKAESICSDLPCSRLAILPDCGHLSHEEVPHALLQHLVPFCGDLLQAHGAAVAGAVAAAAAGLGAAVAGGGAGGRR